MIFFHHKSIVPKPRFGAWLFVVLIVAFAVIAQYKVAIGLTGLGVLLILAGVLVELNAPRIWAESKSWRSKNRKKMPIWNRPSQAYYNANIYLLIPFIVIVGIVCIITALNINS